MARQIALLRGVNVGGNKRVEMARLRELLEQLGYDDVRTHLNSGNAVFSGPQRSEEHLENAIATTFGFAVPVVLRSRDEVAAVVEVNPLRDVATDPAKYLVVFCGSEASTDLDPVDFAPGTFQVTGREIYLWAPGGIADSPLAKLLATKSLGAKSTARNWRTVEKLLELADSA